MDDAPDLVIGGLSRMSKASVCYVTYASSADTVVLSHHVTPTTTTHHSEVPDKRPDILEKPQNKADNLRMLMELNGGACEVVTGVTVGKSAFSIITTEYSSRCSLSNTYRTWLWHQVRLMSTSLDDSILICLGDRSIEERTVVHFSDNPVHVLRAYADNGEGLDRAGGFAIQVCEKTCSDL
jgi:septum formation protein